MRKLILLENPCPTFQAYLSGTAGRAGRSHGTPPPPPSTSPRPPTVGQKLYTYILSIGVISLWSTIKGTGSRDRIQIY